jgi:hypothetical protein
MIFSHRATRHSTTRNRFAEFANVVLVAPLNTEGESLPVGAAGTIVEVFDDGRAYAVEFFEPRHCVVTVFDNQLAAQTR